MQIILLSGGPRALLTIMKPAARYKLVLVTTPDLKTARRLARGALKARLIACANLVPAIESHYTWRGKFERANEVLLLLKTTGARLSKLEAFILMEHPYDTPEFLVIAPAHGSEKYLDWLNRSCGV